jgi:hypothetical protein
MQQEGGVGEIINLLLPLLIPWLVFALPVYKMAKRKGVGTGRMVFGMFPLWMAMFAIWWASLPDKDLLDRLKRLEGKE